MPSIEEELLLSLEDGGFRVYVREVGSIMVAKYTVNQAQLSFSGPSSDSNPHLQFEDFGSKGVGSLGSRPGDFQGEGVAMASESDGISSPCYSPPSPFIEVSNPRNCSPVADSSKEVEEVQMFTPGKEANAVNEVGDCNEDIISRVEESLSEGNTNSFIALPLSICVF